MWSNCRPQDRSSNSSSVRHISREAAFFSTSMMSMFWWDTEKKKREKTGKGKEETNSSCRVIFKEQEWPKMSLFHFPILGERRLDELELSATHCLRRENRHVMVSKQLASSQKDPIRLRKHHTIHVGIATDNNNTNGWFGLRFRHVHNSLFSHFLLPL